jgi:peptide chain release factor 1
LLGIMEGDMDDVVEALQAYEAAQQLAALENSL